MLEAVQDRMGTTDLMSLKPVMIAPDALAFIVMVRPETLAMVVMRSEPVPRPLRMTMALPAVTALACQPDTLITI